MATSLFKEQDLSRVSFLLAICAIGVLLARFLTVVVVAEKFGMSGIADIIFIAQLIPINVFLQNRKVVLISFVPVYMGYKIEGDEQKLWHLMSQFTNLFFRFGFIVSLLYLLGAPYLMRPLTIGFASEHRELTIHLTQILAPIILFLLIFSVEESLLYSNKHFTTSNWTMLLGSLGGLLGLLFLTDRYGVFGYGYGLLAGYSLQVAIPLFLFWKYRKEFSLALDLKDPGLRKVYKLMWPVYSFGLLMVMIHVVSRALAATLGPGRVSAFQYSGILTWTLPILLANSILVPLFPSISEKVAKKEVESLKEMLCRGTEILVFSVTPIVISIILLRVPIVRLLFERGEFTAEDTRLTAYTLAFFAPLILAMVLSMLYMEVVVSMGLVHSAGKWTVLVVPVNFLLASTLMRVLDVGGIALAFSLGLFVQTGIGGFFIWQHIGAIGLSRLVGPSIKILIGCAFCAVPTYYFSQFMELTFDMSHVGFRFIGVASGGAAFFLLYACFSLIFCRKELRSLYELTSKRKEGKGGEMKMPVMGGG